MLATTKTRTAIFEAIQQKRFFSTLDKNLRLSFKLNGQEMGSTVNAGSLTLIVSAADGDNESFNRIQLYKNGIVAQTWTPNQANATATTTITATDGDFYYITVRQVDGDEAVSSPIYISGTTNTETNILMTNQISVFPNPTEGNFTLDYKSPLKGDLYINIFNIEGKELVKLKLLKTEESFNYKYDASELTKGTYFIQAKINNQKDNALLIIK